MSQLQEALERITYHTRKFPEEEFRIIKQNFEEAKPYLYAAIEKAFTERELLEDNYQLHFYALFFLAEFKDTEAFEKIIEFVTLPSDILNLLIGDLATEGLSDILYHTYNGNRELLKDTIRNQQSDQYVRSAVLYVMGQLYLDGELDRQEWQDFLKELVYAEEDEEEGISSWLAWIICRCHLVELRPEVRYLFDKNMVDTFIFGAYDSGIDIMFSYDKRDEEFCRPQISIDRLKGWAMFEQEQKQTGAARKDFEKQMKAVQREWKQQPEKKVKVGRNAPCPCGSGKKYKYCCMNKPKEEIQQPESEQERQRWLKDYPPAGTERIEGRIYLEDYYDLESIEIDKKIYLALKQRAIPIWNREAESVAEARKRFYLWGGFF